MIREQNGVFELTTDRTTYLFRVRQNGLLEHLYYGKRVDFLKGDGRDAGRVEAVAGKRAFAPGNAVCYEQEDLSYSQEAACMEFSAPGKGDPGEPFVEMVFPDGSRTVDFVFESFEIGEGRKRFRTMPGSYDETGKASELKIVLKERNQNIFLELYYWVYPECDVISRSAVLENKGEESVFALRLMSMFLDLDTDEYMVRSFTGAWAREMHQNRTPANGGKLVLSSMTGTSSNRVNPFFLLEREQTQEDCGECFGFHLIYSGNHYEAIECGAYGRTRIVSGINPQAFSWELAPGTRLEAPEAAVTYTVQGRNGVSRSFHAFIREHIVRGTWKHKERPVLLNSWEAFYFDFQESKLLKLAETAKNIGIELFVLDDGWFGKRDDDTKSLGDWQENRKKLPGGLKALADKIKAMGLSFGIWVEPEMVNTDSDLYRAHPEWVLEIPGRAHSEGRNQRVLDLGKRQVQDYLIEEMSRVFSSADISYVKWDMNRIFSDTFSQGLVPKNQGEVFHRYQIGLYRCMKELTERFPEILFEGCASGGNRFDLGILCYFPQIWASDNTDAICRAEIQNGYSYGYPQSVISAHVSSCPNHQTLRMTPLETRFAVASFGILGYECNLTDLKREELDAIRLQIELYKEWRPVLQFGQLLRGKCFSAEAGGSGTLRDGQGNLQEWFCVSGDRKRAAAVLLQRFAIPNNHSVRLRMKGLEEDQVYHFCNRNLKYNVKGFGDLVNTVAPIHIRQDSLLHNVVAKFVKMDGETEDYLLEGRALMNAGVSLKQPFGGTGYNEQVRYFPDFAARMYFMEAVCEEKEEAKEEESCPAE